MNNVHVITAEFEKLICSYTGSKYCAAVDNNSNAIFLALYYEHNIKKSCDEIISIPARTYPSVPCEIKHAGLKVHFINSNTLTLKGAYQLKGSKVWDSALKFTYNMYTPNTHMCLSFTGPYKHLKLSKGGAIITDDYDAYLWFKRARNSGRRECSYHEDNFDMIGWNYYMMPEIATRGIMMMSQFYNPSNGEPIKNDDIELKYPDLSKFSIYQH